MWASSGWGCEQSLLLLGWLLPARDLHCLVKDDTDVHGRVVLQQRQHSMWHCFIYNGKCVSYRQLWQTSLDCSKNSPQQCKVSQHVTPLPVLPDSAQNLVRESFTNSQFPNSTPFLVTHPSTPFSPPPPSITHARHGSSLWILIWRDPAGTKAPLQAPSMSRCWSWETRACHLCWTVPSLPNLIPSLYCRP